MNLRRFDINKDYTDYSKLYKEWDLPITPKSWISEDTFIIEAGGQIVCAGSLYQLSNTSMFWIEGLVTNKYLDKSLKQEGLQILIKELSKIAKEKGAEVIMTSTPREGLKETFKDCGFRQTPEKYYHLGRLE